MRRNLANQILTAGLDVLHSRGYHGSSVQDITTRAGVPKGSFYNHFSSKEALAISAIDAYIADSPNQILADETMAPMDRLRAHFESLGARFTESGLTRGCLVGNFAAEVADHSEPIRRKLADVFDEWAASIETVLTEAYEANELAAHLDPATLSRFIIHSWEGALLAAKASKTQAPLQVFFDAVFGVLTPKGN